MSRYLQADEEKLRMQSFVRECVSSGLLEPSQSARLVADLQVDLRETNPFLRAVLFLFTGLIVAASVGLVVTVLGVDNNVPLAVTFFMSAPVCLGLAEYLVGRFHWYRFGVEEALAASAVLLTSFGAALLISADIRGATYSVTAFTSLSVGAAGAFAIYRRFGYLYAA